MKLKSIFLTGMLLAASTFGLACTCYPAGELDIVQFNQVNLAFVGIAEEVVLDKENYQRIVTFKITKRIKSPRKGKRIVVYTALESATCGLTINEGTKWYIWASQTDDGIYRSSICSRSMRLIDELIEQSDDTRYHKDLAYIKSLKKKRGISTFTYEGGSAKGKLKCGFPVGEWYYYDENGKLRLICQYSKKGREHSCEDTSAKR